MLFFCSIDKMGTFSSRTMALASGIDGGSSLVIVKASKTDMFILTGQRYPVVFGAVFLYAV